MCVKYVVIIQHAILIKIISELVVDSVEFSHFLFANQTKSDTLEVDEQDIYYINIYIYICSDKDLLVTLNKPP